MKTRIFSIVFVICFSSAVYAQTKPAAPATPQSDP